MSNFSGYELTRFSELMLKFDGFWPDVVSVTL